MKQLTQKIVSKLKKGLDEEYLITATGSTRTKDNKNLALSVKEAEHVCVLLNQINSK